MGPELVLLVENDTDVDVTVQARNLSVNNFMVDPFFSADVAAGKKSNETMTFPTEDLETAGIEQIKNIEFYFTIFDANTWDEISNSDVITITTNAPDVEQEFPDDKTLVFDDKDIKIYAGELSDKDTYWPVSQYFYVENNTSKNITVYAKNVSINGFMIDPYFSVNVVSGKKAISSLKFGDSDLADNDISGIDGITDLEFSFYISDLESWEPIVESDEITLNFK